MDHNRERVEDLRKRGMAAVQGNAAEAAVLIKAHIADAAMLVVATAEPLDVRQMAATALTLNPDIEIIVRGHGEEEAELLRQDRVGTVFLGEEALAGGMTRRVLERFTPRSPESERRHD